MFGLFNKSFNSPEDKLKHDMIRKIKNMAHLYFRESPLKGTPFEGTALIAAINQAEEFYSSRSIAISEDYGASREKTLAIIKESAKLVLKESIN